MSKTSTVKAKWSLVDCFPYISFIVGLMENSYIFDETGQHETRQYCLSFKKKKCDPPWIVRRVGRERVE